MVGSNDDPNCCCRLKPFYDFVIPLSWFVVRAAAGWNLLVHSWGKITVGPASGFLKAFVDYWLHASSPVVLDRTVHRNSGRHRANPWIVHAVFCRRCRDRTADYHRDILAQRIFLAAAGIRIHATLGLDLFCDCISAAAVHIPLIAQSAKNHKAETCLNAQCPLLAQSGHRLSALHMSATDPKADIGREAGIGCELFIDPRKRPVTLRLPRRAPFCTNRVCKRPVRCQAGLAIDAATEPFNGTAKATMKELVPPQCNVAYETLIPQT